MSWAPLFFAAVLAGSLALLVRTVRRERERIQAALLQRDAALLARRRRRPPYVHSVGPIVYSQDEELIQAALRQLREDGLA